MSLNLDFGKLAEPPEDIYLFTVAEVEVKHPKPGERNAKGDLKSPYLNFRHQIVEGDYEGRSVFDIASLSPKALFRLQAFLRALTGDPWEDDNMQLEPSELLGMTFKGITEHQTYDRSDGTEGLKSVIKSFHPADYDPYAPDFVRDKENDTDEEPF